MALPKLFQRIFWHNNTTPALAEDNLNAMSKGLSDVDDRLISLAGTIQEDVVEIQEDMEILNLALETIDDSVASAQGSASTASAKAIIASNKALVAEGFAVGEQNGTEVGQDSDYYENNAKYYANIANPPIRVLKDYAPIISITDAINKKARDVKIKLEPVQDLHGYTKPWPGGAGKNKFTYNLDGLKAANTEGTWSGNVYSHIGLTFTVLTDSANNVLGIKVNGTSNNSGYFYLDTMTLSASSWKLNGAPIGATATVSYLRVGKGTGNSFFASCVDGADKSIDITTTDSYIFAIAVPAAGAVNNNLTYTPMLRDPSTSATYEPPTNICPITGWSQILLARCGKNLFGGELYNGIINQNGEYQSATNRLTNSTTGANSAIKVGIGKYTLSCTELDNCTVIIKDKYGNLVNNIYANSWQNLPLTFNVTQDDCWLYFTVKKADNSNISPSDGYSVQVEKGETATTYEQFQGNYYIILLNGLYYKAIHDPISGTLTVLGVVEIYNGTENWTHNTGTPGAPRAYLNGLPNGVPHIYSYWVNHPGATFSNSLDYSNQTIYGGYYSIGSTGIYVNYLNENEDLTALKARLAETPLRVFYPYENPVVISKSSFSLELFFGNNTLYANSGDVALEYDASGIVRIAEAKLDIDVFKEVVAASSDFANFKSRVAQL